MKKIINRKNAAAVACAAMMICAAGAKCEYACAGGRSCGADKSASGHRADI